MTTTTALTRRSALAALAALAAGELRAQAAFPSRPVQLIVPATPGGPVSETANVLAPALSRHWRQRVNLQYVPGNGTVTGVQAVARSPADGHHIGLATSALAINAALRNNLPYSTLGDLAPVCLLARFEYAIFAHSSLPVRNIVELVNYAKRRNMPLPYASPGIGTGPHVAMESFAYEAGFRVAHRPFISSVPAQKAVQAGELPLLAAGLSATVEAALHSPLQLVALMGHKGSMAAKGVSWASDAVPGFEVTGHVGAIAPRGVPPAIVQQLGFDLAATVRLPAVKAALAGLGMETIGMFSSEADAHLRTDIARWRLVGRAANIQLN